jgi:probable addiction module antidote protein
MEIKDFDVAEWLKTDDDIQGFLADTLREGMASDYLHALNTAARAKGMRETAKKAGIGRESLYRSLRAKNPRFDTVLKATKALGFNLEIVPAGR